MIKGFADKKINPIFLTNITYVQPLAGHGNLSASCSEPKNQCRKRPKSMLFERSEFIDFSFQTSVFSVRRMKP